MLTAAKVVLMVIDMQNGFVNERSQHVVPKVVDLVRRWSATGRPVVFTRYHNYPGSPYERLMHWSKLREPPETDIVPQLVPQAAAAHAVINKKIYSCFVPEFNALLAQKGWTDLVFCGIATEGCVLKSAVDAFERELIPWLVADASASHGGEAAHQAGLLVARRFIGAGQLITAADVAATDDPAHG